MGILANIAAITPAKISNLSPKTKIKSGLILLNTSENFFIPSDVKLDTSFSESKFFKIFIFLVILKPSFTISL